MKSGYSIGVFACSIIAIIIFAIPLLIAIRALATAGEIVASLYRDDLYDSIDETINLIIFASVVLLIVGALTIVSGFFLSVKGKWSLGCVVLSSILATIGVISLLQQRFDIHILAFLNVINFVAMTVCAIKCPKPKEEVPYLA